METATPEYREKLYEELNYLIDEENSLIHTKSNKSGLTQLEIIEKQIKVKNELRRVNLILSL